jgi:hypothetical protein
MHRTLLLRHLLGQLVAAAVFAQGTPTVSQAKVEAWPGILELSSDVSNRETVIVITPNSRVGDESKQRVVVLQYLEGEALPLNWSGRGRLLLSEGLAAILGDDGTRRMFMFPDQPIPESLRHYTFDMFRVFGIARYGEKRGLKGEEIGRLKGSDSATASPNEVIKCPSSCGCSGGPHATSCSCGDCSISCTGGWYACCWRSGYAYRCHCCNTI